MQHGYNPVWGRIMGKKITCPAVLVFCSALLMAGLCEGAEPLNKATFTGVTNDVTVLKSAQGTGVPARVNDIVAAPSLVRTGQKSRAELRAPDDTITRVGANTVLSFNQDGRGVNLQEGSVLFHSPQGKGGGTIQTAAVTAAVTGTTIIVTATRDGGFKLLVLEGKGKATLPNGRSVSLTAGQLVFVLAKQRGFSPVMNYQLGKQTKGSNLLGGFDTPLASLPKIERAIANQENLISGGDFVVTNFLVTDDGATATGVPVVSPTTLQVVSGGGKLAEVTAAFGRDVVLTSTTFDPAQLFDSSYFSIAAPLVGETATNYDASDLAYIGHNIDILSSGLDLSPYASADTFSIVASGDITLPGTFSPVTGPANLDLNAPLGTIYAGSISYNGELSVEANFLNITNGSSISSNGYLELASYNDINLTGVNFTNSDPFSSTDIATEGMLTLAGGSFNEPSHLQLESFGDMSVSNVGLAVGNSLLFQTKGMMTLTNEVFNQSNVDLQASAGMTLAGATFTNSAANIQAMTGGNMLLTATTTFVGGDVNLQAGPLMTANAATFNVGTYSHIRMAATEIVLNNVQFPNVNVDLYTATGNWSSAGPVPNGVYFNNSTYAGSPITGSGGPGVVATAGPNSLISH